MAVDRSKINRILVVTLSNLGDIVLTTPVIATLRANFPNAYISVVAGPKGLALLQHSTTINEVVIYDKTKPLAVRAKFVWQLREKKFDLVIDLRNTAIPLLVGARYFNSIFFDHSEKQARKKHLSRLQFLGLREAEHNFEFFNDNEEKSALAKLKDAGASSMKPWIAIAPGAANHLKRWPLERYGELAVHFEKRGFQPIILGNGAERVMGDQIMRSYPLESAINMCGLFELRELAAFLSRAKAFVCNDSGLMHLANELGIPVLAIFGPTDHLQYAKFGLKNRVIHGDGSQNSIHQVQTEEAIHACEELLSSVSD